MRQPRDPYETPPAPRERGGPLLRFAIVAALLAAAAWGYATYANGPTLMQAEQQDQTLADVSQDRGYAASPTVPQAAPPPEAAPAPVRRAAPAPAPEAVPPPTTTTAPPSSGG